MLRYGAVLIVLTMTHSGCLARKPRIIGGDDCLIEDYPYMVSIEYDGDQKCGGSILSENYILTAAHCFLEGGNFKHIIVRSGTSFKEKYGIIHRIEKSIYHENCRKQTDGRYINDVAVVKINPPIIFGKTRQPIKLFNPNDTIKAGTMGIVSGWGRTEKTNWNNQLQSVAVPVLQRHLCTPLKVESGVLCASFLGVGGKDACLGDSSGPLVIDGRQAGIVSWGIGCAMAWYPGVYVDVAYYREWIDRYVQY